MKKTILYTAALALISCDSNEKPNIVIFLADDMGWGDVNANGNIHFLNKTK